MWYGWFSAKGYHSGFTSSFTYANPDGGEVVVTCISREGQNPPSAFGDEECVGPVTHYLRENPPINKIFPWTQKLGFSS